MPTLFISDIHLTEQDPIITAAFLDLVQHQAQQCQQVYILGDLFDVWLGDDAITTFHEVILNAIYALSQQGSEVFFMHGNRDFLVGDIFAQRTGCHLLDQTTVIDLNGQKTLLLHGDQLCSEDVDYQQFRQQVRNPTWQQSFLSLPIPQRIQLASQARDMSTSKTQQTADAILDASQQTIIKTMQAANVSQLIHGHTHRPAVHHFLLNGQMAERIVLGDWGPKCSTLLFEKDHFVLNDRRIHYHSTQSAH